MPRSGTTLLEQILDMHPAFHGAGELHDMAMVAQRYYATGNGEAVLQACDAFGRKGSNLTPRAAWCIDKMPHNFVHAGMILHLFPPARVIWCRRDPMDNCTSIYRQHFRGIHPYAHDLGTLGRYFRWHEEVMEGTGRIIPSGCWRCPMRRWRMICLVP
ncbi:MAG: sulfotransferase family protein [Acidithiobacillus ferrivorans]